MNDRTDTEEPHWRQLLSLWSAVARRAWGPLGAAWLVVTLASTALTSWAGPIGPMGTSFGALSLDASEWLWLLALQALAGIRLALFRPMRMISSEPPRTFDSIRAVFRAARPRMGVCVRWEIMRAVVILTILQLATRWTHPAAGVVALAPLLLSTAAVPWFLAARDHSIVEALGASVRRIFLHPRAWIFWTLAAAIPIVVVVIVDIILGGWGFTALGNLYVQIKLSFYLWLLLGSVHLGLDAVERRASEGNSTTDRFSG